MKKGFFILLLFFALVINAQTTTKPTIKGVKASRIDPIGSGDNLYYRDYDGDTYGDPEYPTRTSPSIGFVANNLDCNDFNANINPTTKWYYDNDGDGYGSTIVKGISCLKPVGSSLLNTDCDDGNSSIHPGAIEIQDGLDNDCDGFIDEGFIPIDDSILVIIEGPFTVNVGNEETYSTFIKSVEVPETFNWTVTGGIIQNQTKTNITIKWTVVGSGSIVFTGNNPYYTFAGSRTITIVQPPVENMNWIKSKAFNINGAIIANSKVYFDELGKGIQSQSVDIKTGHIWASQTMYDEQGRPGLQTLSAPINNTGEFLYNPDFNKKTDGITTNTVSDYETNIENPKPVGATVNTLGWYYSENNTNEPYQDITSYPFSRTIYSELNPGTARKVIGGNKIDTNEDGIGDIWKSAYTFSMPASQELSQTTAFNNPQYNAIKTIKTVSRNIQGVETVVFTDTDGKTLAAARSGGSTTNNNTINIGEQGFVDIHVPVGITTGFTITKPAGITTEVYDLITEQINATATTNLPNGFYRVAITNLDSYDALSSPVTITYKDNYYDFSLNKYDKAGRLISSKQPLRDANENHLESLFDYNSLGQLIYTKSPDEGEAWFKYRNDGQIRYSQNSKQKVASPQEFSYTNYDTLGRPVESGVLISAAFNTAEPDYELPAGIKKERNKTTYDGLEQSDYTFLNTLNASYHTPMFLASNVAKTSNENTITYYNYDIYGRVLWIVQNITGLGTKTIDYEYDPVTSAVTKVDFQRYNTGERFIHKYTYNVANELIKVETSTDNTNFITQADYQYYETGALKRVEIAEGLQGIDYVYNLAGQLKAINNPELTSGKDPNGDTNDLFGMQLNYYKGDYLRPNTNIASPSEGINQYNGNIKSVVWNTSALGTATPDTYYFKYNKNNWLEGASFNDPLLGASGGTSITDFSQTWDYTNFITSTGGGSPVNLTSVNNTVTFTYSASFQNSYIKTGSVVQINYPIPDMDLGYISVTRTTGEIITNQFKVSIVNGWIVINADDPYYHSLQYTGMKSLGNSVTIPLGGTPADDQISTTGDYNVFDITYDANGNIQTLNRNKDTENATNEMDKFTYNYIAGKNQLSNVDDIVTADTGVDDLKDQNPNNYVYNSIGQLTKNVKESIKYFYNASGLVTEVQKNNIPLVKFFYNDKGMRVRKEVYVNNNLIKTEYYVRDVAGSVLAIYNGLNQKELPIYGASRLGIYFKTSNTSVYQLTDHLGNVRAVIAKDAQNNAVATTATDYYPFGMPMPNRQMIGGELYRYAFQGQEKDPETGKEAFQLRLWDGRIGRWLTTDPYGEFHSPYMGMGNNPISVIDTNGGCTTCPDNAKIGDTYEHSNYGTLTFTDTGWGNSEFGNILDDIMISGKGSGLNGIAGVRFEQWKQIIQPDITRRKAEWKGAYAMALSPFAVIGAIEVGPTLISTKFWVGKAVASTITQGLSFDGDIDIADVVLDATLVSGASPLFRGLIDVRPQTGNYGIYGISSNKSNRNFLIEVGSGYIGYGLGARISPMIGNLENNTTQSIAQFMLDTNYSFTANGINKKLQSNYGN